MQELELQNVYNKCLLDDEDYEVFKNIKCYSSKDGHVTFWDNANVQIHRAILKITSKDKIIDHIDGNPFNNQKCNLRICVRAQNCKNLKRSSNNTSGYKGVSFYNSSHRWLARIMVNGESIRLGYFKTPKQASKAYDEASTKYHGQFGVTNLELKKREPVEIEWKPTKFEDANLKPGMIPLGNKEYSYVDLEDYDRTMKYKWHLSGKYVASSVLTKNGYRNMYLHTFIMNTPKNLFVDHIDRNPLNNRKENLRLCTKQENSYNRTYKTPKSKYRGVKKANSKWAARISLNGKEKHIGVFDTPELAAIEYNKAAREYHGEFASLNII